MPWRVVIARHSCVARSRAPEARRRMVRMPVLDVRLEDALGAGTVLAKFAGKVPLLGVYRPDVCLKIPLLYGDELAEAATEHLHIVVDRIDVDLAGGEAKKNRKQYRR